MLCFCYRFIMLLLYFHWKIIVNEVLFFILYYLYGYTYDYVTKELPIETKILCNKRNALKK